MKPLFLISLLFLVSCSTVSKVTTEKPKLEDQTVFYFIRHAETVKDITDNDPILSVAGKQHALRYIDFFKDLSIDEVYSTNFNRTKETVNPLAKSRNLEVQIYNPYKLDYADFVSKAKNKTIVVVGHSNTTPELANKVIGKFVYSQMTEDNYSDIFKVIIEPDGSINSEIVILN